MTIQEIDMQIKKLKDEMKSQDKTKWTQSKKDKVKKLGVIIQPFSLYIKNRMLKEDDDNEFCDREII